MKRTFSKKPITASQSNSISARKLATNILNAMHQLESSLEDADDYPIADRFYEETGINLDEFQDAYRTLKEEWNS